MTQAATSIDPRLISMVGRKLYSSNPLPIVVRELLQNSIDACARKGVEPKITIAIREFRGNWNDWIVSCEDNGIGMTEDQIVNDFLCLGGKKDSMNGQTGGFGIAKAAILGCSDWKVRSLDNHLNKHILETGGDIRKQQYRDGTKVTVRITDSVYDSSVKKALQMIYYSDVDVHLIVEKDDYQQIHLNDPNAGLLSQESFDRRILDENEFFTLWGCEELTLPDEASSFGTDGTGWNIVRLNGLMQFRYGIRLDYRQTNLFFDIITDKDPEDAGYPFSMSREEMESSLKKMVEGFVASHNANVIESVVAVKEEIPDEELITVLPGRLLAGGRETTYDRHRRASRSGMGNKTTGTHTIEEKVRQIHQGSDAPVRMLIRRYKKDPQTRAWHAKVLLVWQDVVQVAAENNEEFGIGITSDRYKEASRLIMDGDIYYVLNPDLAVKDELIDQSPEAIVLYLWTLACHEATHKYVDDHNEWFTTTESNIQRDSSEVILRCLRKIARRLG